MELKDKLVNAFMAFENQVDLDHPVHDVRSAAMKVFENQGFPTKKMEAWKYTSLKSLEKLDFNIFPKEAATLEYKDVKKYFLHEVDT
ncbi:MAG: Fe-S cluster assembly protein SufD, partial [Flavobacteriaceae bacterium]|nr:Fe-S cluster assembly protein SufD [Flavobacteriaceae bacterium]